MDAVTPLNQSQQASVGELGAVGEEHRLQQRTPEPSQTEHYSGTTKPMLVLPYMEYGVLFIGMPF